MKTIAVLCYPDCQILDVTGPLQVFASANQALEKDFYQIKVIGLTADPITTNSGMRLLPDTVFDEVPELDTLLIAGGRGVASQRENQALVGWIKQQAGTVRRIGSVCSGAFLLAEAGLLQGKQVTTHWRCCDLLSQDYPDLNVDFDAIWIKQGRLYTSAGVTSGIDLALALVEEDCGHSVAMDVARELVVFIKRPGGQAQYSTQLQAQQQATGTVAKAISYIEQNLTSELNLEQLADHCCVSERHLFRLFKESISQSPAAYIEDCRLNLAQQLLVEGTLSMQQVADGCGFIVPDNLRRVFIRRLGVTPSEYKARFISSQQGTDS
ncbi:GlxA family transcriptional regulator [Neptuniibacter sp.]|uniref:GlxA family transcriptional regulator n=1 Tax=Neptuniibacter sp. TaxID=1962643 RepID=UPI0026210E76|nr:GlxA family transcriptional regulator [Neptuniibacter sp.]MCP4598660.1 GlxA family transcriptional regulator [Neptuniibacter sp.]